MNGIEVARLYGDASAFSTFAYPQRRALLADLSDGWVAFGARWRGAPVGLALAKAGEQGHWLDSVMVSAQFRRRGVGRALLEALTDHARSVGSAQIAAQYSSFLRAREALEGLLAACGWSAPQLLDIQLVGLAGAMADGGGAWRPVQRAMRELGDYRVESFRPRPDDAAAIKAILASAPELGVHDPLENTRLEAEVSTAIRHGDELIGWIAAERLTVSHGHGTLVPDAPSILYSGARIADGHHKALMLVGYHRAFSCQAELYGAASRAVYRTHPRATAMYTFTRARFEPMALHVEERYGARCAIDTPISRPVSVPEAKIPC